ncbi:MAG: diaminopropionate ammonia-lyase [candidate division Zixibacteria bacterium]|nr:diaminopropionate ammonia-lyase [candidate division Zixibacteria bacterium]MDH3936419.1 diaminopropionate ammonia-lyase [candidate division Zixibacteria bacterium]
MEPCFEINRHRQVAPIWDDAINSEFKSCEASSVHRSLKEYAPTPLVSLPVLAERLGIGELLVKDESHRFGLNAFKALGSTYAIYQVIKQLLNENSQSCPPSERFYRDSPLPSGSFTFTTATDGNHGRGVAWVARQLAQKAVIYMPKETVPARIENIRNEGAEVIVVDGSYDAAVARCREDALARDWQILSDTGWPGYEQIPRWIQAGYLTMFEEIHKDAANQVDVVIVQAGVGALAAAAAWYYNRIYPEPHPKLVSVEPLTADCCMQSIQTTDGEPITIAGDPSSIMAGLNCGTPSPIAWPFVKQGYDLFVSISDDSGREAMRSCFYPTDDDPRIISGESGAAGLAALTTLVNDPAFTPAREFLHIDSTSRVLVINTEGDTDPAGFAGIVG